ncbi:bestrophin family ion channel [Xanthomonas campestris pv. raphani]|uniref:bestrophin family protein n=1 Tax=Xanthomonas campestris TaxID=339 RepID=UPI000E32C6A1|nr:bestrophin family ion channel [Xanthomonas campestris]MEA9652709.1 bestrophin family ion channel [Xanthomonas campestris pv. raphani]MEA9673253.1 bestrophin family ion channel [Xanthomonas campestris pv. raphani]MEA9753578.1 bestrophin family ion channel [Xanthomonas campestris pv. raphani]MEA9760255.1 bestrophin family ion channel [Xanthomonas campestris pv. raphani]MEA9761659.1 bestrophin family ion channel [Xanthomonas campestris pv. raphani]
MIIDVKPRVTDVFLQVWRTLAVLFVWDVLVTIIYYVLPFRAPALPLTIFGSALALFLGFRANSTYQRWWEGRVLWGQMINASRNLVRLCVSVLSAPDAAAVGRSIALRQVAYVHALRCQLRRLPVGVELEPRLDVDEVAAVVTRTNVANGLLDTTGRAVEQARRDGWIDSIQQASVERILVDIANAQGGMERLKNTPLPYQYRFYPNLFTRVFCILLPIGLVETLQYATPVGSTVAGLMFLAVLKIGDELVDPFANTIHDLPLDSMCRTVEIDALQAIGERAPEPLQPVDGVLW